MRSSLRLTGVLCLLFATSYGMARDASKELFFVKAKAANAEERTRIANAGVAIDAVQSDSVSFLATDEELKNLQKAGIAFTVAPMPDRVWGFPGSDQAFHDYKETLEALDELARQYPGIAQRVSIGRSLEGRDLAGIRLSSAPKHDSLPTSLLLGCHHAREHLSVEVPLKAAQYLARNYATNPRIKELLDTREVWIVPMINPDGAEYDIATGRYRMWRKNRRDNGDGTYGVDLNRNYATGWGGPGSSASPKSDVYHGPGAFSEPETRAVRDFTRARSKATTMISFHTFSELVLWPYGNTNDDIPNTADREVFEKMGRKMASWNGYKPMKSSALYLASGDTADWAYDELNIFAFTFELSPRSLFQGGFYPGARAIEPTFQANLEPILYLIEMTADPYQVLNRSRDPLGMLH